MGTEANHHQRGRILCRKVAQPHDRNPRPTIQRWAYPCVYQSVRLFLKITHLMLNWVCRCRTLTLFVYVRRLAPPLPHRWQAGWTMEGRRAGKATPKGGGAGVERCAPVTVYIYFSPCLSALVTPCLSRFRSVSPLRVHHVIVSRFAFTFARLAEVYPEAGRGDVQGRGCAPLESSTFLWRVIGMCWKYSVTMC